MVWYAPEFISDCGFNALFHCMPMQGSDMPHVPPQQRFLLAARCSRDSSRPSDQFRQVFSAYCIADSAIGYNKHCTDVLDEIADEQIEMLMRWELVV